MDGMLSSVNDIDFNFENSSVRVTLLREITGTHLRIEALTSARVGQEIEVPYWAAKVLVDQQYAKFREEDSLNFNSLSKIHWRETIPSSRQIPSLPQGFYCHLRRYITELREAGRLDPAKHRELEKTEALTRDIVNCRIRKVVSLAASPSASDEILQGLTYEERALYHILNGTIDEWKMRILG